MLYGSPGHSPSSHKSRIELQTHIVCFYVYTLLSGVAGRGCGRNSTPSEQHPQNLVRKSFGKVRTGIYVCAGMKHALE